ncbi:MAG: peptide deformylase [Bryobacteraceae bacterium]|nr:peptide deformylase [Bryobacteraceae bacterium]
MNDYYSAHPLRYHVSMPAQRIRQLGDPVLRAVCTPATPGPEAQSVLDDLRDTLYEFRRTRGFGRGIAAPQIGVEKRLIYIEIDRSPLPLINPVFEWQSEEKLRLWDDCFSFPDLLVQLERAASVRIRYLDPSGLERRLEATGALSELLQHEIDHLNGVLAVDRALDQNSLCTREEYNRRISPGRAESA